MEKIRLGDICNPKQWKTLATSELKANGKYLVYGANGVIGYYDDYNHEKETVLITCRGATCGNVHISKEKSYINGNAMAIDNLNEKICLKEYLYYFLKQYDMKKIISGSAQPQITVQNLKNIDITIVDIDTQTKIVKKLNKIQEIIDIRKKQIEELDESVKSQFIEMFGDPILNPMQWGAKKLKDISNKIMSGNTPKGGDKVYVSSGIEFYRSQNVWKNKLEKNDIVYIDEEIHKNMAKSSLKHNDLLITKTGRINTENSSLGRTAIYDGEDDKANINGHVYLVRLNKNENHEFILRILISDQYREYIRSVCVGGIDKRQLNKEHIENFPIIYPPIELQKQFSDIVRQIDKQKFEIQKSLKEIEKLQKSLMNIYFGG